MKNDAMTFLVIGNLILMGIIFHSIDTNINVRE